MYISLSSVCPLSQLFSRKQDFFAQDEQSLHAEKMHQKLAERGGFLYKKISPKRLYSQGRFLSLLPTDRKRTKSHKTPRPLFFVSTAFLVMSYEARQMASAIFLAVMRVLRTVWWSRSDVTRFAHNDVVLTHSDALRRRRKMM